MYQTRNESSQDILLNQSHENFMSLPWERNLEESKID